MPGLSVKVMTPHLSPGRCVQPAAFYPSLEWSRETGREFRLVGCPLSLEAVLL